MHRDRLVVLRLQTADKARHGALDVHLIRRAAERQERHRVAGQELELGVRRAAAEGRNEQIARHGVLRALLKAVHERHIVLVGLEIAHHAEVGERLVHDNDDVGRVRALLALVGRGERVKRVRTVPLGCADDGLAGAAQEVVELAVRAARRPEIDARARDAEAVVNGIRRECDHDKRAAAPHIPPVEQLPAALHQADEHAVQHRRAHAAQHGQLDRR